MLAVRFAVRTWTTDTGAWTGRTQAPILTTFHCNPGGAKVGQTGLFLLINQFFLRHEPVYSAA